MTPWKAYLIHTHTIKSYDIIEYNRAIGNKDYLVLQSPA